MSARVLPRSRRAPQETGLPMVSEDVNASMTEKSAPCAPAKPEPKKPDLKGFIRAFLKGESHGEELLHALYDSILEEPIPERLRAVLRRS